VWKRRIHSAEVRRDRTRGVPPQRRRAARARAACMLEPDRSRRGGRRRRTRASCRATASHALLARTRAMNRALPRVTARCGRVPPGSFSNSENARADARWEHTRWRSREAVRRRRRSDVRGRAVPQGRATGVVVTSRTRAIEDARVQVRRRGNRFRRYAFEVTGVARGAGVGWRA